MDAIADAAGVSRQTVFSAFRSKPGLVKEMINSLIMGADAPAAIAQREALEAMRREPDPRQLLGLNAHFVTKIAERTAHAFEVAAAAALVETELAEFLREVEQRRLDGMRWVVDLLDSIGAIKNSASRDRLAEGLWLLTAPNLYRMAQALQWSSTEYERWLADCSVAFVLAGSSPEK